MLTALLLDVIPLEPRRPKLTPLPESVYVGAVWRRHATLAGAAAWPYPSLEKKPCPGRLIFTEVDGPVLVAACDTCKYETGVRRADVAAR